MVINWQKCAEERRKISLVLVLAGLAAIPAWGGTILFDDLGNPNFSASAMTSSLYDAVQLHTDGNTYTVTQATLVLQASDQIILTQNPGQAPVNNQEIIGSGLLSIYDATGPAAQPGNNLGTFTGPSSLTTTFGDNVFTDAGIVLLPNTEYWLVFQVTAGTVSWGIDDPGAPGTGPLFDGGYSNGTLGAGFPDGIFYPTQTQLVGDVAIQSSTPEPGTLWLMVAGLVAVLFGRVNRRAVRSR